MGSAVIVEAVRTPVAIRPGGEPATPPGPGRACHGARRNG